MRNSLGGGAAAPVVADPDADQRAPGICRLADTLLNMPVSLDAAAEPTIAAASSNNSCQDNAAMDEDPPAIPALPAKSKTAVQTLPAKSKTAVQTVHRPAAALKKKGAIKREAGAPVAEVSAETTHVSSKIPETELLPASQVAAMTETDADALSPSRALAVANGASISEERPIGRSNGDYDLSALRGISENAKLKWDPALKPAQGADRMSPALRTQVSNVSAVEAVEAQGNSGGAPSAPFAERWASKSASARRSAVMELATALRSPGSVLSSEQAMVLCGSAVLAVVQDGTQLISEAGIFLAAAAASPGALSAGRCPFLSDEACSKDLVKAVVSKAFASAKSPLGDAAVDAVVGCVAACSTGIACAAEELCAALRGMSKPKAVRNAARALTRLVSSRPPSLRPCLKPEALVQALPTVLLCADKAVSSAGLELAAALASLPHPSPYARAVCSMVQEYTTGVKGGGFCLELATAITAGVQAGEGCEGEGKDGDKAALGDMPSDPVEAEWAVLDASAQAQSSAGNAPKDMSKIITALRLDEKMAPNAENKDTKEKLKWKDRVDAIDELLALLSKHPRLSGEPLAYSDAVTGLRKALKDTNAAVVAKAIAGLTALGVRMRANCGSVVRGSLQDLCLRLREKRGAPLVASLHCMRSFVRYECVGIEDVTALVPPGEEAWKKAGPEYRRNMLSLACSILLPTGTGMPQSCPLVGPSPACGVRMRALAALTAAGLADASGEVKMEAERVLATLVLRCDSSHPTLSPLLEALEAESKAGRERVKAMIEGRVQLMPVAVEAQGGTAAVPEPVKAPAAPVARGRPATATATAGPPSSSAAAKPAPRAVSSAHGQAAAGKGAASKVAPLPAPTSSSALTDAAWEASIAEEGGCLPDMEAASTALLGGLEGLGYGPAQHEMHDSSKWQDRKAAVESLVSALCSSKDTGPGRYVEASVALLHGKTGGFKPTGGLNNAALLSAVAQALEKIACACTNPAQFSRRAARVVLDGLLPYLKEKKGSEDVGRMAVALAAVCGPNYVASRLMAAGAGEKATPGIMSAVNERLGSMVEMHGVGRLSAGHILPHLMGPAGMQAPSLPVKTPAIKAVMSMHAQMGPPLEMAVLAKSKDKSKAPSGVGEPPNKWGISDMLEKSLREGFAKAGYSSEKARALLDGTRAVVGEGRAPVVRVHGEAGSGGACESAHAGGDEDAAERVDVLSLLPPSCLCDMDCEGAAGEVGGGGAALGDKPWQVRMKAVDTAVACLAACITAGGGGGEAVLVNDNAVTLLKALKRRLGDVQANVKPRACLAIASLARAAGPALAPSACRTVVPTLLEMLGDKKAGLKEAAVAAMDALVSADGSPSPTCHAPALTAVLHVVNTSGVLGDGGGSLGATSAVGVGEGSGTGVGITGAIRETLMPWIARHIVSLPKGGAGVLPVAAGLVPAALDCAGDRLPAVRKAAGEVLAQLARLVGGKPLQTGLASLRDAQRLALTKVVEEACGAARAMACGAAVREDGRGGGVEEEQQGGEGEMVAPAQAQPKKAAAGASSSTGALAGTLKAGVKPGAPKVAGKGHVHVGAPATAGFMDGDGGGGGGNGYALLKGAPAGKASRAREGAGGVKGWELRTHGEGSSDLGKEVERLGKGLKVDLERAKVLSEKLLSDLFPRVDNGPVSLRCGLDWLSSTLTAALTDDAAGSAGAASTLEAARDGSDLLLKLAVLSLYDPKCRPVLMAASARLLDALLTAHERCGWGLSRYEGDVLMPALCERVAELGGGDGLGVSMLTRALTLLRNVREYQPGVKGVPDIDGYAAAAEHYVCRRVYDSSAKPSTRAALVSALGRIVAMRCDGGAASPATCTLALRSIRKTHLIALSRLLDRDAPPDGLGMGMAATMGAVGSGSASSHGAGGGAARTGGAAKPAPAEVRSAVLDLLGEVFLAAGKDSGRLTALLAADGAAAAKGRTTLSLSAAAASAVEKSVVAYAKKREAELAKVKAEAVAAGKGVGASMQAATGAALALAQSSTGEGRVDEAVLAQDMEMALREMEEGLPPHRARGVAAGSPGGVYPSEPELLAALRRDMERGDGKSRDSTDGLLSPQVPVLKTKPAAIKVAKSVTIALPLPLDAPLPPSTDVFLGGCTFTGPTTFFVEEGTLNRAEIASAVQAIRQAVVSRFKADVTRAAAGWCASLSRALFQPCQQDTGVGARVEDKAAYVFKPGACEALVKVGDGVAGALALGLRGLAAWARKEWPGFGPGTKDACTWAQFLDLANQLCTLTNGLFLTEALATDISLPVVQDLCVATLALATVSHLFQDGEGGAGGGVKAARNSLANTGRRVCFRARRDHVLVVYARLMGQVARWSPALGAVSAKPAIREGALRTATVLFRRVPTFEWKYRGSVNRLAGAGQPGSTSLCSLQAVAAAFKEALDDPAVAVRARRVLAAEAAWAGAGTRATSTTPCPSMQLFPSSSSSLPQDMDEGGNAAVYEAVSALLAVFGALTVQQGLALDGPLRAAGAGPERAGPLLPSTDAQPPPPHSSFTRSLYHAHLSAMATEQGVNSLAGVQPVAFSREAGEAVAAQMRSADSISPAGLSPLRGLSTPAKTPGKSAQAPGQAGKAWTPASSLLEASRRQVASHLHSLSQGGTGVCALSFNEAARVAGLACGQAMLASATVLASTRKDKGKEARTGSGLEGTGGSLASLGSFSSTLGLGALGSVSEVDEAVVSPARIITAAPLLPSVYGAGSGPMYDGTPSAPTPAVFRSRGVPAVRTPAPVIAPTPGPARIAQADPPPLPAHGELDLADLSSATTRGTGAVPPPLSCLGSSRVMPTAAAIKASLASSAGGVEAEVPLLAEQPTATTAGEQLPARVRALLLPLLAALMDTATMPNAAVRDHIGELGTLALQVCTPLPSHVATAIGTAVAGCGVKPDMTRMCPFAATVMLALGAAGAADYSQPFGKPSTRARVIVTNFTAWAKARGGKADVRSCRLPLTLACDAVIEREDADKKAGARERGAQGREDSVQPVQTADRRLSAGVGPHARRISGQGLATVSNGEGNKAHVALAGKVAATQQHERELHM